jgi:hypothetical protein
MGQALLAQLVGELDDQDAVLGDQPHQGDQADLRIDVERAAAQHSASSAPTIDSGTDSMMTKRVDEALELRRQHQEDEQQRQHEHHHQRALRGGTRARCRSGRCCSRAGAPWPVVHELERLAQRVVGRQVGRGDGDRAALAEVVQLARLTPSRTLTSADSGTMVSPWPRTKMRSMSSGVVRPRPRSARSRRTARRRACSA